MNLRLSLFTWVVVTVLAAGMVVSIMFNYLPAVSSSYTNQVADGLTLAVFYASIFLFITGIGVFLGYGLRAFVGKGVHKNTQWPVIRQATIVAIGVTSLLALQGFRVLSWWDAILLFVALLLVELSFWIKPA